MRIKKRKWTMPFLNKFKEKQITLEDLETTKFSDLFGEKKIILEIGSGKGDFIATMASKYPEYLFIGVEVNLTVAAIALKKILDENINNAYLARLNVKDLLPKIPGESIHGIFLNFSDPWPKKRHEKRRLTHEDFIDEYWRILIKEGKVYLKTDNTSFFEYSLDKFRQYDWRVNYINYEYKGNEPFDAETEYERSFRREGLYIKRLIAIKGGRSHASK
jgi:tRNA (guanine-N7-)-methyltransferase